MKEYTLAAAATAGAGVVNSGSFDLVDLKDYSIQVNFSGTDLVGTLKLQAIATASEFANSDRVDIASTSQAVTGAASHIWNVSGAQYRYVRAVWTWTSGTGNWTVTMASKETVFVGG